MASSLEKLVENLYDKNDKYVNFPCMKQYFNDEIDLLCRKGFYPYEWVDNDSKLDFDGLPSQDKFYSKLSQSSISDNDYQHAQNVYKTLNCKSFLDYHLTYLKCDVLLLADVFENFRNTCQNYYGLDPANYISAPGLAWDAMLLKSNIQLELMHDTKVLDIMERMKRGGLCFVGSKRHVKANNQYMETYDDKQESNYLMYLDANNLYGWAMSQLLPHDKIKISNDVDIEEVLATPDDNETGYIIECDLTFPEELHDKFKEFPPAPEILTPEDSWMSDYQLELKDKLNIKSKSNKLVPHLMEHKNYCIHYRNLKYIKSLGVKIGNVHNVVSFKQKAWLEPYIDFNTQMRKKAKNDFEKDFFKLMNNAVFGKTMENVKNRINIHATTSNKNAIKWFSKINMKGCKEFNGLYLIEMYKEEIVYDKPLYVGTSILDLSKLCMMEFHYDVIHKEFEGKYNLIYSDTDSLVYNIRCDDFYKWMGANKHHFDLSDCKIPELKDDANKKVLAKFKLEIDFMIEFLALNPKVYSIKYYDTLENIEVKNKKTLKGVSKTTVKKEICHADYVNVLTTDKTESRNVCSIRSFNHELFTFVQEKVALTSYYDKMKMLDYNTCVPFGFVAPSTD